MPSFFGKQMDVITRGWYKKWFGNEYLTVYAHRDEREASRVIVLLLSHVTLPPHAKILDLCCGQGRHALLLAQHGYSVYGIDLSRALLEIAKFKNKSKAKAHFIQADMRYLPVNGKFDLLMNLFTSFGYFHKDRDNQDVFHQFQVALKPGAPFLFDYMNISWVQKNFSPYHKEKIGSVIIEQERQIVRDRIVKKIIIHKENKQQIFFESVRMYQPDTIFEMLREAGLIPLKLFGDYNGKDFEINSPRFIVLGKRE
jgi:ubiquinone/menaquinone biosynthesis C-methylase UbiE